MLARPFANDYVGELGVRRGVRCATNLRPRRRSVVACIGNAVHKLPITTCYVRQACIQLTLSPFCGLFV